MDFNMEEAQKRLEEKRESLKQTRPIPIGLGTVVELGDYLGPCTVCGKDATATEGDVFFLNMDIYAYRAMPKNLKCKECSAKAQEEEKLAQEQREQQSRERMRQERVERLIERSGIGNLFLDATWDDYKPVNKDAAAVKIICHEYADTFTRTAGDLVMIGACGTGKNMLASLVGLHIMRNEFSYFYTTAMRLVRTVKDSWRDKDSSEQEVIDSFTRPNLLCIDEIGVQFGSPTEQLFITEVINNRYEAKRPTILISNLTLPQVEEVLGARAIDRFHERGKFLVFKWDSYRRRR
jgi:DNA replication protein DnaC